MRKFLVPTDFSETSKNAARYAAQVAEATKDARIILCNVSDKVTGGSDGSPLTESHADRLAILNQALQLMKEDLQKVADVPVDFLVEDGSSLVETLGRIVRHQGIDIVIMGITGATRLEQIFIGSNTLDMANASECPVMIVPPDAKYNGIKNVLLCSDFKDVETETPIAAIKSFLDLFKPTLHIVNVDHEHYVELTDEYKIERNKLENMLKGYNPEFYFIRIYDFLDAISLFAQDKSIDVILTVPKKHFFKGFFTTSHTKKLAYHSTVPVFAIHE
jgi:nucleotide-binding universal stress UspA family protein